MFRQWVSDSFVQFDLICTVSPLIFLLSRSIHTWESKVVGYCHCNKVMLKQECCHGQVAGMCVWECASPPVTVCGGWVVGSGLKYTRTKLIPTLQPGFNPCWFYVWKGYPASLPTSRPELHEALCGKTLVWMGTTQAQPRHNPGTTQAANNQGDRNESHWFTSLDHPLVTMWGQWIIS